MSDKCDSTLCELIRLCKEMIDLVDEGMQHCEHDKCMLLYSHAIDFAYRLKSEASIRVKELAVE